MINGVLAEITEVNFETNEVHVRVIEDIDYKFKIGAGYVMLSPVPSFLNEKEQNSGLQE